MNQFHDVRFPLDLALGARGGPSRQTDIIVLASGGEARNARHKHSRRRYDAGVGVKSLADMERLIAFFEARLGQLYSFRFTDPLDHRADDQPLGVGDGQQTRFPLIKTYADAAGAYERPIRFATIETIEPDLPFTLDEGEVVFATPINAGVSVRASFTFDTLVRFDTDQLDIALDDFGAGEITSIPLIEMLPHEAIS